MEELNQLLKPVWLSPVPGVGLRAWDTGRRRFFGLLAFVYYRDLDGKFYAGWESPDNLLSRDL